jgi:hypothetical protein
LSGADGGFGHVLAEDVADRGVVAVGDGVDDALVAFPGGEARF